MNEWIYILLGFLGGVVFSIILVVSTIIRMFNRFKGGE